MTMGALEGDFTELQADEERSSLEGEKQDRAAVEAQTGLLQKEKEDTKAELDQLRSEKEAPRKQLNELESETSAAEDEINRLKDKLGKAKGKVNELQLYKAAIASTTLVGARLLPEVLDEVTLDRICTKLPWRTFRILSSVNHCWQEAIRSRQVYHARVRTQSAETFVCVVRAPYYEVSSNVSSIEEMKGMGFGAMFGLYSLTEDSFYQLPPIPYLSTRYLGSGGLPASCQCVLLDGKIYVLGGTDNPNSIQRGRCACAEVYVLDVVLQRPWKQLANMTEGRMDFGACVLDGKIYVLGGTSRYKPVHGSEVYDPELDKWSPIAPMPSLRSEHTVAVIGGELVVFDGWEFDRVNAEDAEVADDDEKFPGHFEVYHPATNEWRRVSNHDDGFVDRPYFTANGKVYVMLSECLFSLDADGDGGYEWTRHQKNLFPDMVPRDPDSVLPCAAVAVNDEVLAVVQCSFEDEPDILSAEGTFVFQSTGFYEVGNETGPNGGVRSLGWQKVKCSFPFAGMSKSGSMFLIQL